MRTRVFATLVALLASLYGCASPSGERDELLTPPAAGEVGTPAGTGLGSPDMTTGSPSPAQLDRQLSDSEEFRRRREALAARVASVVQDERVVAAMTAVPRHAFVPTRELDEAYADYPLPIGYGQTISQPSLVALMTELLQIEPGDRVLEIGTGSGYQAAILAELTEHVYSVEIVPELAATARQVLDGLGYSEVVTARRDGYLGWPEHAPYDAIVVTAAPDHLPQPLVEQLSEEGGRMVIPIGPVGDVQTLWLVTRENGEPRMERVLDVRFVPLVREGE
ncbi:MAG: protein-L-isoaspartate(D-aspartate) O-methyltransferase [Chloroflexota bacterium]|nr:protein-L-isoaspartate(D-aspartate) O-methyltransferase [Chloroflexota bacterium]